MKNTILFLFLYLVSFQNAFFAQEEMTYAEKLGWKKGQKVIILHVDDVGMSYESNQGAINAIEKGVATSLSVMMPCSFVPDFVHHYLQKNPTMDVGLHLTLTSEWEGYRWGPLSGKKMTPGLVDKEGCLWRNVPLTVQNASADEIEMEIRAQIERARTMGFEPTHLDSHMGTLFAKDDFLERYIKVGIEERIPVMFPGGHNTIVWEETKQSSPERKALSQQLGQMLWGAGLPVLDDLSSRSYEWSYPKDKKYNQKKHQAYKTQFFINELKTIKPGLTMVIMHCNMHSDHFQHISASGLIRTGDLLAMQDPKLKAFIEKEGIVLTTWREVMQRRKASTY